MAFWRRGVYSSSENVSRVAAASRIRARIARRISIDSLEYRP
jgi:hypothetical protein